MKNMKIVDGVLSLKLFGKPFFTPQPQRYAQDVTTKIIGDFGKWQLRISILMALLKLSNAWYQLNIIFMAPAQEFWCEIPSNLSENSIEPWKKMYASTDKESSCLTFDSNNIPTSLDNNTPEFHPAMPCKKFIYDTTIFKRTMVSDWDLVCGEHWKVFVTQGVMMTGVLCGGVIFGVLADRYGRKTPLMIAIVLQSTTSFIASILPSYGIFLANWFVLALASGGITITSFVLCMETVSGKWRMIIPLLYQVPFGIGSTVMALLAYWLRDWRKLEVALASLSSLYILYWFCIPESPRWLIANGQIDKATDVLKDAARENNREWNAKDIRELLPKPVERRISPGFSDFLKHKNMRLKTILLCINWFCTGLGFYAFSQYLGGIAVNIFLTVVVSGMISIPGPLICIFVITRTGRKKTVWIFQSVTTICFVAIMLIPREVFPNDWPRLLFAGIGFAGMAAYVPTLYLFTGELYPTLGRNVAVGGITTFARLGSMAAPFIVALDALKPDLPLVLLTVTSCAQLFLLVPLPETKDTVLPETLEEAEAITK